MTSNETPHSVIISTGSYLPEKIVTNADMEKIVETSDEWIVQRSGIKQRHIANASETTSFMATKAAQEALENAGIKAEDIDGIVVATTTPDKTFPSVATQVQRALEIPPCLALDVQAVCSGFIYALSVANGFIKTKQAKKILVIGAEKMSSILNWEDRTTCVLFGDGAGAVILNSENDTDRGIYSTHLYANGKQGDLLCTSGGPATTKDSGFIEMHGREVFKYAVFYMSQVVQEALDENNMTADQIDWLVPHQANIRILESTAKKLNVDLNKVVITLDKHGNTSAASIPLALNNAVNDGRIQKNQIILLEAMGGGFTWGSALIRF